MIRQMIGWTLVIAAWGVVVYVIATLLITHFALTPDAPEEPRTWPTTHYTDVPLIPPPADPGPV